MMPFTFLILTQMLSFLSSVDLSCWLQKMNYMYKSDWPLIFTGSAVVRFLLVHDLHCFKKTSISRVSRILLANLSMRKGRLYFLKQLKRAGVSEKHLLHFYTTVLRPILEYCAPVWHYGLTLTQAQQLEAIQKRAIHVIFNFSKGLSYSSMLFATDLESLAHHREISPETFLLV